MTPQRRPRRSAQQCQQLIDAQMASEQSIEAFCQAHDLGFETFRRWKNHLNRTAQEPGSSRPARPVFEPLLSGPEPEERPAAGWDIERALGEDVCLRLRRV